MSSSSSSSILRSRSVKLCAILGLTLALSACDFVASFTKPKQTPEEAKAEGIALGAGCRQAGQTLEDCYQRNPDSLKAGIFAGWKDMHEYMAAKNIPTVTPPPPPEKPAEAEKEKDPKDERAARKERRERERMEREKEKEKEKSKNSDKDSKRRDSSENSSRKRSDERDSSSGR